MGLNNVFYWDILKLKAQKLHADQVVYIYECDPRCLQDL